MSNKQERVLYFTVSFYTRRGRVYIQHKRLFSHLP